ncbi:hypothetical protein, partial [Klebsiella pneumoniae]|uniref:hypothetical protein n=1 Tax=Klebsiella pneumoniae TaxID=573 RepID=UPI001A917D8E
QKGVKTRNPRELTSVSAGVEGRKQRIGSVKGAPHLTQHFALQKGVKTRNPRELTSVSAGVEGRKQRIGSVKGAP